jgi:type IX secretion system PorP/SprF family membrane protein
MKRVVFFLFFINILYTNSWAADPQFTQFYSAPLYLSPSFAGATQQNRISVNYRKQWISIPGGYETYAVAYDHYFTHYNSGLGLLFMRDQAGSGHLGYSYYNLLYSYDFTLSGTWHIRPGISFLYKTFSIDFSKLKFYDQVSSNDPNMPSTETPPEQEIRGTIDGAVSSIVYNSDFWAGFTVDHLLKPNQSFFGDKIPIDLKYSIFGGVRLVKKGRLLRPLEESVSIAYLFKMQGDYKQLDLGLYWYKSPIIFGLWYRGLPIINKERGDAVAFLVGLKAYQMSFGYSYDFTISNLINSTGGSHELSLIYEFQTKKKKRYHALPCPEF